MTYCGAKKKQGPGNCTQSAGWGTQHPGSGKCKLHGGASTGRIIHGRYAQIKSPRLKELIEKLSQEPDPMNLEPEVILLRALVLDFVERYDDYIDGLIRWNESWGPAINTVLTSVEHAEIVTAAHALRGAAQLRPHQVLDISAVSMLVERLGKMVERIQKIKSEGAITLETLTTILQKMGVVVARNVDAETAAKIEQQWRELPA